MKTRQPDHSYSLQVTLFHPVSFSNPPCAIKLRSSTSFTLSIFILHLLLVRLNRRSRIFMQDSLLNQIFRLGPMGDLLIQAVCTHTHLQLLLVALDCWSSRGIWKDVACGIEQLITKPKFIDELKSIRSTRSSR